MLLCLAGLVLIANIYAESILLVSLEYPGIDKLAHFVMHMLLLVGIYALLRRLLSAWTSTRTLVVALLICLALGMLDEAQQLLVAARRFDVFDVLANICGCLSAAILIVARQSKRRSVALLLILPLLGVYGLVQYSQYRQQYYNAGLVYIKNKNYTAARQAFLLAVDRGEYSPALFNELAWLELEYLHSDPAISVQYSRRALAAQPDNADFLDTHGWALFMNGQYSEACNISNCLMQTTARDIVSITIWVRPILHSICTARQSGICVRSWHSTMMIILQ